MKNTRIYNLPIMVLTLALLSMGEQMFAMETGVYQAPDISKYILIDEKENDGDGDGEKETLIQYYVNEARNSVFSMTTKHQLWAWSLDSHGGGVADLESNYVIRDSDCDGAFDERYNLDEQFFLPDCLK